MRPSPTRNGWPADLSHNDILARLVALNKERAREEANGLVRWLRPDYQLRRFGSAAQKAQLRLLGDAAGSGRRRRAEARLPDRQRGADRRRHGGVGDLRRPLDGAAIAASFKQGRRVAPQVAAVLAALARMGFVSTSDRGRSFSIRRAS